MNAIALTRPAELSGYRVRLAAGAAAAGRARRHVRAAIRHWGVPVDPDTAALLASELVTNAITHETGPAVTLAVSRSLDRLRVEVHDTSAAWPEPADADAWAERGRGLMLVDVLSAEWGWYRTPAGKAVYFTLAAEPAPG